MANPFDTDERNGTVRLYVVRGWRISGIGYCRGIGFPGSALSKAADLLLVEAALACGQDLESLAGVPGGTCRQTPDVRSSASGRLPVAIDNNVINGY